MRIYYTDGSALPNPGHGGYAVILNSQPVALGSENPSTNIRMEAKALIAAIKHAVSSSEPYKICTDSQFWINVVKIWAPNWEKRGWHKKHSQSPAGSDIANFDLVIELYELYRRHRPHLEWTRGHVGTIGNELADEWASKARRGAKLH